MPAILAADEVAELQRAPFTYPDVGATATEAPEGYHRLDLTRTLRRRDFSAAAAELLTWRVQERAGLRVMASGEQVTTDAVVRMTLGVGRIGIRIPCRVVYVLDDIGRAGFAYGSLPGHPESGEERFLLEQDPDGTLTFSVSAFSKLATPLSRLGGPVSRVAQTLMVKRYLSALDA